MQSKKQSFLLPRHKGGFEVWKTSGFCLEALQFGRFTVNGMIWCSTMKDAMSMHLTKLFGKFS
jgi:hypothetical protein